MASTTLTVAVSDKAYAAACKVADRLLGDDCQTPVDVVADAIVQFRAEVGRDPLSMDELQAWSDGEEVDTTPPEVLTVAALREMLMVRGLRGAGGMTKAQLCEYLRTGDKPAKPAPKAGTVAALRAEAAELGVKGRSTMPADVLRAQVSRAKMFGVGYANANRPAAAPPKPGTCAALKAEAKARNLTGYSGLRKDDVAEYLATGVRPAKRPANPGTCDWMREQLKARNVKGYSGKNREALLALCAANGIAV